MRKRDSRSGYTLVEVLLVVGIMGIIAAGALALMVGSLSCFDSTSTEAFTDTDAVIAMQMIVNDVREAKSISIIDSGARLRVTFPKRTTDGYYDRHEPDIANQTDYYLSDDTGDPGRAGTWLWRANDSGGRRSLKKDVVALQFEQDTSRSVRITVTTRNYAANGPKQAQLTQRVVYLRNY